MNTPLKPDHLSPSVLPRERKALSAGVVVALVGCGGLLLFLLLDRGQTPSAEKSSAGSEPVVKQKTEKERQKELVVYLQQHPHDEFAHFQLGELIRKRAPFQALENFSHVSPGNPHYLEAVEAIASIALAQDLPEKAKPALQTLIRQDPDNAQTQAALARLYLQEGRYRRALRYARRCVALEPERVENQLLMAEILRGAGRISEMREPLKQAIYLEPESYSAHLSLAYAALYSGDTATAEREARWCLSHQADSTTALRYLAMIDRNRGEIQAAMKNIDQALEIDPTDFDCLLLKADLLIYERQGEAAYDLLKPFYAEQKTNRHYVTALARAAGLTGKRAEALQLQQLNQRLIKDEDLRPSSLQSDSVEKKQATQN